MAIGKTKEFSPREFERILINNGFVYVNCKGSHKHYKRGSELVVIPHTKCNKMIARRLIKEHNLVF